MLGPFIASSRALRSYVAGAKALNWLPSQNAALTSLVSISDKACDVRRLSQISLVLDNRKRREYAWGVSCQRVEAPS